MSEPRVVQPLVVMQPPPDPLSNYDEATSGQFVEDTTIPTGLTFEEWVTQRRPLPFPESAEVDLSTDVPEI
jgi:hypothetical protein